MTHAARPPLPYGKRSPAWLHRRLSNLLGADVIGLFIGEDMVLDSANNVTSWPGRVGGTLAIVDTNYRVMRIVNGRRTSYTNDSTVNRAYKDTTIGSSKAMIGVCSIPPLPFAQFKKGLNNSAESGFVMGKNATNDFWTTGGCAHFVDGVATESAVMSSGLHVIEGDFAGGNTQFILGGYAAPGIGAQNWNADIACALCLANIPSAGNRASSLSILQEYYGLR